MIFLREKNDNILDDNDDIMATIPLVRVRKMMNIRLVMTKPVYHLTEERRDTSKAYYFSRGSSVALFKSLKIPRFVEKFQKLQKCIRNLH